MDATTMLGMLIMGWLSGYLMRLLKKVILAVLAGQAVFLIWLEKQGIISINYSAVYEKFGDLIRGIVNMSPEILIKYGSVGLPYACGFLLGLFVPKSIVPPSRRKYLKVGG